MSREEAFSQLMFRTMLAGGSEGPLHAHVVAPSRSSLSPRAPGGASPEARGAQSLPGCCFTLRCVPQAERTQSVEAMMLTLNDVPL